MANNKRNIFSGNPSLDNGQPAQTATDGGPDLVYTQEGARKKAPGRLNLSPARAGQ